MKEVTAVLKNREGLHARPAAVFAKAVSNVRSGIKIYKNGDMQKAYNPKSLLSVLSMGAGMGDKLTLVLEGEDEETAALELKQLLESDLEA